MFSACTGMTHIKMDCVFFNLLPVFGNYKTTSTCTSQSNFPWVIKCTEIVSIEIYKQETMSSQIQFVEFEHVV